MFSPDHPKTPYFFSEGAILRSPTPERGIPERCDGRVDVVSDPDPGWSSAAVDGPQQDHADVPRARMARLARSEFAAIRLPCTERFTINVTVEFRAMMDALRPLHNEKGGPHCCLTCISTWRPSMVAIAVPDVSQSARLWRSRMLVELKIIDKITDRALFAVWKGFSVMKSTR